MAGDFPCDLDEQGISADMARGYPGQKTLVVVDWQAVPVVQGEGNHRVRDYTSVYHGQGAPAEMAQLCEEHYWLPQQEKG